MKNLISTACVLSVFLLVLLACSNADTRNFATGSTSSTDQNYSSDTSVTDDISDTAPIAEPTIEQAKSTLKPAIVIAESAELRESASQNSLVIDSVSEDASLQVVKQKGVWFLVRTDDEKEGWIHGNSFRYLDQTQTRHLTVSKDLKVEPETDLSTEDFVPQYIPPIPQIKPVEIETRQAETYVAPVPVYRSTPETTYSRQYETPTITSSSSSESSIPTARCADGTLSYSTSRRGTCSWHGGVAEWLDSSPSTSTTTSPDYTAPRRSTSPSSNDTEYRPKTVYVRGYTRKDGTYVAPHMRSAPRGRRN
jgi:hypothetical protein